MNIVFRALAIGARSWVFGDLIHKRNSDGLMIQDTSTGVGYDVDPSSVGQYTGRADVDGELIFSGDIIEVNGNVRKVVFFDPESAAFSLVNVAEYNGPYRKYFCKQPGRPWWNFNHLKVIGNIYDNPDMLGKRVGE